MHRELTWHSNCFSNDQVAAVAPRGPAARLVDPRSPVATMAPRSPAADTANMAAKIGRKGRETVGEREQRKKRGSI